MRVNREVRARDTFPNLAELEDRFRRSKAIRIRFSACLSSISVLCDMGYQLQLNGHLYRRPERVEERTTSKYSLTFFNYVHSQDCSCLRLREYLLQEQLEASDLDAYHRNLKKIKDMKRSGAFFQDLLEE